MKPPAGIGAVLGFLNRYRGFVALGLVFLLGVVYSPSSLQTGRPIFLEINTQQDILFEYCEYGLLATGMTLVILTGGIDLSVSSVLGFCATLFALLTVGYGWGIPGSVAVVTLAGLAAGCVNGALVSRFSLQPFVATLAMMTAARGLAKLVSGGTKVQPAAQPWFAMQNDTPPFFEWMTQRLPGLGLQPATLLFLICAVAMAVVMARSGYGRQVLAIGGNEEAARLAGMPVARTKVMTYALCGLFAALAGVVNACRQDLGDPEAGFTFELDAIAAVVIGGTSLAGGRGGVLYTVVGVLIMAYINKILSLNNVPLDRRMILQGAIIVAAVLIQRKGRSTK